MWLVPDAGECASQDFSPRRGPPPVEALEMFAEERHRRTIASAAAVLATLLWAAGAAAPSVEVEGERPPTARSDVNESSHLTTAQFKVVDDYLVAAHHLANTELVPLLAYTRAPANPAGEEADNATSDTEVVEEYVADWLAAAWEETPTLQHYVVLLRATQVAAFTAGFHLQVDLDQLIGTASGMPRRALRTSAVWARLHAYPEPHRGAVCALAAAGMSVSVMPDVRVDDFDPETALVPVHGTRYRVEEHARIFLTAQQHYRRLHGAAGDDPLFVRSDCRAYAARAFATIIKTTRRELGVAVASARIDRTTVTGDRWYTRWGICIQELL